MSVDKDLMWTLKVDYKKYILLRGWVETLQAVIRILHLQNYWNGMLFVQIIIKRVSILRILRGNLNWIKKTQGG